MEMQIMPKKLPYHRKRLGQVFLRDALVVEQILQSAALAPDDTVLEIGPGRGILTAALAKRTHALYAIEVDAHYVHSLQQYFASATHIHIIEADARFYDYGLLPQPLVVVANLPYSMGMAILQRLLTFRQRLSRLVIMLQQEVAARLLALPNSSAYGALSVFFQYYADITHNLDVSRYAFAPVPAVDSSVMTLRPFPVLPWPECDERWLFRLVRTAFAHRRKTLRANLLAAFPHTLTRTALADVFTDLALNEHARAQELSVHQFVQLAQALQSLRGADRDEASHSLSWPDPELPL
jgi:16S rRNA (adenine1518-N6/adenine1519-N6)-dimethyltransferase